MKRALLVLAAILVVSPVFAQSAGGGGTLGTSGTLDTSGSIKQVSDLYPVRVDIVRVFSHAQGFRVVYRKGQTGFAEAYVPSTWFVAGGKAQLIRAHGPVYPYMVVYYKSDGTFSHLKLYVQRNLSDPTWGQISGDPGDVFKVDTIKLEY